MIGNPNIPHDVCKTKYFKEMFEEIALKYEFENCVWARLRQMKQIYQRAYEMFKKRDLNRGALLTSEKIHWAVTALRSVHNGDEKNFKKAFQAAPSMANDIEIMFPPSPRLKPLRGLNIFDVKLIDHRGIV